MFVCVGYFSRLYSLVYPDPVVLKTVGLIPCQLSLRIYPKLSLRIAFVGLVCETQLARFCFGSVIFLQITGKSGQFSQFLQSAKRVKVSKVVFGVGTSKDITIYEVLYSAKPRKISFNIILSKAESHHG